MIRLASKIIMDGVQKLSPNDMFVGHVGGDDFIFICSYDKANDVCQRITETFDKEAPKFYTKEDRARGYIDVQDRRGVVSHFPMASIAIGLVSSRLSRAILTMVVRSTERSMPIGPRTHPQKTRETKTTRVERPRPLPMNLGSMMLPKRVFTMR